MINRSRVCSPVATITHANPHSQTVCVSWCGKLESSDASFYAWFANTHTHTQQQLRMQRRQPRRRESEDGQERALEVPLLLGRLHERTRIRNQLHPPSAESPRDSNDGSRHDESPQLRGRTKGSCGVIFSGFFIDLVFDWGDYCWVARRKLLIFFALATTFQHKSQIAVLKWFLFVT